MRASRRCWAVAGTALLALAALPASELSRVPGAVTLSAAGSKGRPSLQIAPTQDGRCGRFVDAAAGVVSVTEARPGQESPLARVCVRTTAENGRLLLSVRDLSDVDVACSGSEDQIDATCGGNRPGELSGSLVQLHDIDSHCLEERARRSVPLVSLIQQPVVLTELDSSTFCVLLAVRPSGTSHRRSPPPRLPRRTGSAGPTPSCWTPERW